MTNMAGDRVVFIDGKFVSERISQVVQAINEYDDRIEVQYVPESERADWQDAFRLIYNSPNGPQPMFNVKTEQEFDTRVLAKIIANDQQNNPLSNKDLDAYDEAQRRIMDQAWQDKMEEAHDKARFILRTPLHTINMGGGHIIRDRGDNVG
jgi:hypothetical protein